MNTSQNLTFPIPPRSSSGHSSKDKDTNTEEDKRFWDSKVWIGNLDPKLTDGPQAGWPRGYAFVTYEDSNSALKCIQELDSKRILERCVSVRWAHQATLLNQDEEEKIRSKIPALGIKSPEKPLSKTKAITAIEAKLRAMDKDKPNFNLSTTSLQSTKLVSSSSRSSTSASSGSSSTSTRYTPYDRNSALKKRST